MNDLVREASVRPWDETVRGFLRFVRNVPEWVDNLSVNGRYAWKLFLELRPGSRFLDFGCGLGNLTQNLAPHVGEVVALDLTWERLQFAQQRLAKLNLNDRVTLVAAGDGACLPFPDQHFDCVALSGVLEWVADDLEMQDSGESRPSKALKMLMSFFGRTNPRKTQLRFLKELHRILKPDGQIFVAIENRWNYEYFVGHPDHHSGLMYASLLPRFIANVYSIVSARRPYRTYTHSFGGFSRLFATAGFPRQEFYGLSPGYSGLREIIPARTEQSFWRPLRAVALKERLKRNRYFVPAFGTVASTGPVGSTPLLARLLREIGRRCATLGEIAVHECRITGKEKIVFKGVAGEQEIVLKIPVDQQSEAGELNNQRMLESLSRRKGTADIVPRCITSGIHQGVPYFLERAIQGREISTAVDEMTRASAAARVRDLLIKMHAPSGELLSIGEGSDSYARLVTIPVAKLRGAGLDPVQAENLQSHLRGALKERHWPISLYHGDFTNDNIFVWQGKIAGVIDWEYATEHGLPVLDALSYVESMQRLSDSGANVAENLIRLERWDWPSTEEAELLKVIYRHFGVDHGAHPVLCQLCWLQHMGHQLDTPARFDPALLDRHVRPMLAHLAIA